MLSEDLLKSQPDAIRIVFNRFVSAISYKPTIATVLSAEVRPQPPFHFPVWECVVTYLPNSLCPHPLLSRGLCTPSPLLNQRRADPSRCLCVSDFVTSSVPGEGA